MTGLFDSGFLGVAAVLLLLVNMALLVVLLLRKPADPGDAQDALLDGVLQGMREGHEKIERELRRF